MGLLHRLSALAAAVTPFAAALNTPLSRPDLTSSPLEPWRAFPHSPHRWKVCWVPSTPKWWNHHDDLDGDDDAPEILRAFQECNHGGIVVLAGDYLIKSPLDLTFLDSVDVAITGNIRFGTDVDYWVDNLFRYEFQNQVTWWRFGGKDVNIYGGGLGTIDGNGQVWYDAFAKDPLLPRPVLLVLDGLEGGSVTGLNMRQSPEWFNLIANSTDIFVSDIDIFIRSNNSNRASNGDGWNIYRSSNVVIQSSNVDNTDDCVALKPNATDILIQDMRCNGSHGISVGSLGQYPDQFDIVENLYIRDTYMSHASNGARIKVWPGVDSVLAPSLKGGGGSGYVRNVTYDGFHSEDNGWAIVIDQCYGQRNQSLCHEFPSKMTISDITFRDFTGTAGVGHDPKVGTLVCSAEEKCVNIQAHDIHVQPPSGETAEWICSNVDESLLDINCAADDSD